MPAARETAPPEAETEEQPPPQGELGPAPTDVPQTPPAEPPYYSADVLVDVDGYHVMIRGEHLTPKDLGPFLKRLVGGLKSQGFAPVSRALDVDVTTPAAAAAAANGASGGGGEAVWIDDPNGGPPTCSVHRKPAKWVPPGEKDGRKWPGFWACDASRECKPKKQKAA